MGFSENMHVNKSAFMFTCMNSNGFSSASPYDTNTQNDPNEFLSYILDENIHCEVNDFFKVTIEKNAISVMFHSLVLVIKMFMATLL